MAEARSSKVLVSAFIVVIVAAVSIVVVVLVLRSRSTESGLTAALGSSSLEALLASPSSSAGGLESGGQRGIILEKASLKDAIEVARPKMENTVTRLDVGSALLALWASRKLTWDAVQNLPETNSLLFRKDPDSERGKRFCMTGIVTSIRAEKTLAGRLLEDRTLPLVQRAPEDTTAKAAPMGLPSPLTPTPPMPTATDSAMPGASAAAIDGLSIPDEDWTIPNDGKVFFATLQEKPSEAKPGESAVSHAANLAQKELMIVEVVAVRSTQGIVDGSEGRACGVLTGVTLPYLESGGEAVGDAPQHRIVGMFDLPENHAAPGGESH